MKLFFTLCFTLFFATAFSQKEMSLEEAVNNQYRSFYPEQIFGFNWIPETNNYSYIKEYVTLNISSTKSDADK